ncbi:4Fe-4S binding protein [Ruminococcaceae bacterium R-25]|nr:4Fe-4S binding protein [Ruminococcaceae bacterium R-25]SUQ11493.1 4Fe-4S binding domain-containing protein [Oscillospiraceae bacterium]
MNAIYLSGSGNTKHIVTLLLNELGSTGICAPIESEDAMKALEGDEIILAYPTMFSNIPYLVRDFINSHETIWKSKKIFLITTMGLFAGDGTGCAARLLKKYGAEITGGLQIVMPDSIGDCKALKKTKEQNKAIIEKANKRIIEAAKQMKAGNYPKEGLSFAAHLAGLFGQRLWFYNKTTGYTDKLKIDPDKCIGCGICAKNCPTQNIKIENGKAVASSKCTMCYRCIDHCPKQAMTLLGKTLHEQPTYERNSK